jgi:hypothetical protein
MPFVREAFTHCETAAKRALGETGIGTRAWRSNYEGAGNEQDRMLRIVQHATVKISGFEVPMIGIPRDATEQQCDLCHDYYHISGLQWNKAGTQLLCPNCRPE